MKVIVLAAGKGKRLHSEEFHAPKVLRQACGRSLISYVLDNVSFVKKEDTIIVVGYMAEEVKKECGSEYLYSLQAEQLGTGHAVAMAEEHFDENKSEDVLIVYGDMPLFKKETYEEMFRIHKENNADCTVLTAITDDKMAYGRVVRENGQIVSIVEEKDCTPEQKEIKELNVGVYVFKSNQLFKALKGLKNNNAQNEYYLTDVPFILLDEGKKIVSHTIYNTNEIFGVNTIEDLEFCEKILQK